MRYLGLLFLYLVGVYFSLSLHFFAHPWHYVQPMLVSVLLVYFNMSHSWWPYIYAMLAGFFVDSLNAVFGLQAAIFISIIFFLRTLQYSVITFRNILSVIILSIFSLLMYWLLFYIFDLIGEWSFYGWDQWPWLEWLRGLGLNFALVIILHLLYYNLWVRRHERQSF